MRIVKNKNYNYNLFLVLNKETFTLKICPFY